MNRERNHFRQFGSGGLEFVYMQYENVFIWHLDKVQPESEQSSRVKGPNTLFDQRQSIQHRILTSGDGYGEIILSWIVEYSKLKTP